jgi:hypothetical protein
MSGKASDVPDANDLVRLSLGELDAPDAEEKASEVASRIEDVVLDPKTKKIIGYLVAVPSFAGNVELPEPDALCWVQWLTPRGHCVLPTAFEALETTSYGARVWRLRITGTTRRDERRQYFRVPWSLEVELEIRRDLDALDAERQRLLESSGVPELLDDLPEKVLAKAMNVSEGGILCMSAEPALPTYLPLIIRFTIEKTEFVVPARVVWSELRDLPGRMTVESALAFDNPSAQGDVLRPLLFQAQLKARRAGLEPRQR